MSSLERWGFLSLISCMLLVTLSMTVVTGGWAIFVGVIAVVVGILSGSLYAASAQQRR
jgi:O-antigen ligase